MNLKNLLFTLVIFVAGWSISAQNVTYNWHEGITSSNSVTPQDVQINDNGNLFTLTNFVSKSPDLTGEFMGQTFTGVPNSATSGTRNLLLVKSDLSGNYIWGVNSTIGDIDLASSGMALTADGGSFLALKVRHTNNQEQGDTLLRIKSADGTETDIIWDYPGSWVYQGVIVKIAGNGIVEWMKHIPVDYLPAAGATNNVLDGFNFYSATTDATGNLYAAGKLIKAICFPNDTLFPNANKKTGTSFIVKFTNTGDYIAHFTSGGSADYDQINDISFEEGALYAAGLIKGDTSGIATTFGSESMLTPVATNIYAMKIDPSDLSVDWARFYPGIREGGQTIQLKNMNVEQDNIFITGGLNGGIGFTETATTGDLSSPGNALKGFTMKCAISDGHCTAGAIRSTAGIGVAYGTIVTADSVFLFGYDWGGEDHNIYIDSYDLNLNEGKQYGLLNGGGSATAWSVAAAGDTIVLATRCAKNNAVSFFGTDDTFISTGNWGGLITSYIFHGIHGDMTPPSTPTNLAGTATENSVILTWSPSTDNVGVTEYHIYVDDVFNQLVTDTTATITELSPETTYRFEVEAWDAAGNISDRTELSLTTQQGNSIPTYTQQITAAYPNPFHDFIVVNLANSGDVSIFSITGQCIFTMSAIAGENRIQTDILPQGAYILKSGSETIKMIK